MNEQLKKYLNLRESNTKDDLFKYLSYVINFDDAKELELFIKEKYDLLRELDGDKLVKLHIYFYYSRGDYQKVKSLVDDYIAKDIGDVNTYFYLKDLQDSLKNINIDSPKDRNMDEDKLISYLFSNDDVKINQAINFLSKSNLRTYLPYVKKFLISENKYGYKILILIMLKEQEVNNVFVVKRDDKIFSIDIKEVSLPFERKDYLTAIDYLTYLNDDIGILTNARELLNQLEVLNFPDSIFSLYDDVETLIKVFLSYVKKENYGFELVNNTNLTDDEFNNLCKKVKSYIAKIFLENY